MSKSKEKFLKTLKKMDEYEKVAFSRLETFYFAIVKSYSHFNKINTATDENIKEQYIFWNVYCLKKMLMLL